MKSIIKIQNLKCSGCATTIVSKLNQIEQNMDVTVDVENSTVAFDCSSETVLSQIKETLKKAGYPEEGDANTMGTQAKSYVSCAIGKIS